MFWFHNQYSPFKMSTLNDVQYKKWIGAENYCAECFHHIDVLNQINKFSNRQTSGKWS